MKPLFDLSTRVAILACTIAVAFIAVIALQADSSAGSLK
jgi:hypothetical protein